MHQTTYGELNNGDVVGIQGYWFTVQNLRRTPKPKDYSGQWYRDVDVIRFEGIAESTADIAKTSYNGGTYGAYADVPCTIK